VAREYGRPVVVAGFEPLDVLQSISMLLDLLARGEAVVRNQYTRAVLPAGNPLALAAIAETMEVREEFEWRGLGSIPDSAYRLRAADPPFDAERRGRPPRAPPR